MAATEGLRITIDFIDTEGELIRTHGATMFSNPAMTQTELVDAAVDAVRQELMAWAGMTPPDALEDVEDEGFDGEEPEDG